MKRRRLIVPAALIAVLIATLPGTASGVRGRALKRPRARAAAVLLSPPAAIPLTTGWQFRPDPNNVGLGQSWGQGGAPTSGWAPVSIPNDFNPAVSPSGYPGTVGWYETTFTGPAVTPGRSWAVHFEGVRRHTQVWLNGFQIGSSSDPYSPFSFPASTLQPGQSNLLVVRVDDYRAGSLPEDWWNWGGITGPVELDPVGRLSLDQLGVMPSLGCHFRCASLQIQGTITNELPVPFKPTVYVDATGPSGGLRAHAGKLLPEVPGGASETVSFSVPVRGPLALWSPSQPALYQVRVSVKVSNRVEQVRTLRVGLRSAGVHNGILYLNGHRLWLHGAAIHEDISGAGAAMTDGDINTIVSELRSVGANVTRAHYLLDSRLLDALDAAGIVVWQQPPVDHADAWLRSSGGRARALGMLRSTILGDRSHPSVIINSVGNELSPNPDAAPGTESYLKQAIPLARKLDPAALVSLDTYCYPGFRAQKIYRQLDVLGIDSYFGWYTGLPGHSIASLNQLKPFLSRSHQRYPRQALVVSEYGAEGVYDGPASTKGTYEFQTDYLTKTLDIVNRVPFLNGSIYWTLREFAIQPGWTGGAVLPAGDTPDGLHHKGLIAYDGTEKPAFATAEKMLPQPPGFVR